MIADSVKEDGTVKDINTSSTTQNIKLSGDDIDYVMRKLRILADSNKDKTDKSSLNIKNIQKAFSANGNDTEKQDIISIVVFETPVL